MMTRIDTLAAVRNRFSCFIVGGDAEETVIARLKTELVNGIEEREGR